MIPKEMPAPVFSASCCRQSCSCGGSLAARPSRASALLLGIGREGGGWQLSRTNYLIQATCSPAQPPASLNPSTKTTLAVSKRGKAAPPILALAALRQHWPWSLPHRGKEQCCGFGFFRFSFSLCCLFVIEHFEWLQHWQAAGATGPNSSRGQRLRSGFLSHAL